MYLLHALSTCCILTLLPLLAISEPLVQQLLNHTRNADANTYSLLSALTSLNEHLRVKVNKLENEMLSITKRRRGDAMIGQELQQLEQQLSSFRQTASLPIAERLSSSDSVVHRLITSKHVQHVHKAPKRQTHFLLYHRCSDKYVRPVGERRVITSFPPSQHSLYRLHLQSAKKHTFLLQSSDGKFVCISKKGKPITKVSLMSYLC